MTLTPMVALAPRTDAGTDRAGGLGAATAPASASTCAAVPPPDAALRATHLEALLGDPEDPANPYSRATLAAAASTEAAAAPAGALAGIVPPAGDPRGAGGDRLVRVLRPLLRRNLGLGHVWAIRPLLAHPHPAGGSAALLEPAALIAATGGVLHTTARIVDGLSPREPSVRQWQLTLAAAFADLLACECLTTVALRCAPPADDEESVPVAAVGYLVPHLIGGLLADLELVLNESGFGPDSTERRVLAALEAHRAAAGVDWTAAAVRQAQLVRALPGQDDCAGHDRGQDGRTVLPELFRLAQPAPEVAGTDAPARCADALEAALPDAAAHLAAAEGSDPAMTGLARVARRLVTEQRAVRRACRAAAPADPADPAARALADRFALVLLAAAALGVAREASDTGAGFLGSPHWALLALERAGQRLGVPLPGHEADPRAATWAELARRTRQGVDCDVHATPLLW